MVVLLRNKTRELRCYNVGDRGVRVERLVPSVTRSGSTGVKRVTKHVSTSVTLMPGKWTRVPSIMLKQRAVQNDIKKGVLQKVVQDEGAAPPPQPSRKVEVAASAPLKNDKGSHPVEEEGKVKIADHKKAQADASGRGAK